MKWLYDKNMSNPVETFLAKYGLTGEAGKNYFGFTKDKLRTTYKDMDKVVSRLIQAISKNEHIIIYGDYDCDGINATVIMLRALKKVGARVDYLINNRFDEGYGMNPKGIERLLREFPDADLILSCDNGIAAQSAIEEAMSKGLDVLVTDHHRQKGEIIVPTVDEWRDDEDASLREESCGAEIARRTMIALYKEMGLEEEEYLDSLITFSGIATIGDLVSFTAANHYIAKRGLEYLKNPPFAMIKVLTQMCKLADIDEETVGFQIAPLFNALSRVEGSPDAMVDLLIKDQCSLADLDTITSIIECNQHRKEMTDENVERANDIFREEDECTILAGEFDPGIAGLVCSKFVEDYNRPCICLNCIGDVLKGSARSYRDFDLKAALDKCADLLLGYGGHSGAAGLSLKIENLDKFRERMCELVRESGVLNEVPSVTIDYKADIDDFYDETVEKLMSLAPFGMGFERPNIAYRGKVKNLTLLPRKEIEKKHVSFDLAGNEISIKCCWWNCIDKWTSYTSRAGSNEVYVLGTPKVEIFKGEEQFKLTINDLKAAR